MAAAEPALFQCDNCSAVVNVLFRMEERNDAGLVELCEDLCSECYRSSGYAVPRIVPSSPETPLRKKARQTHLEEETAVEDPVEGVHQELLRLERFTQRENEKLFQYGKDLNAYADLLEAGWARCIGSLPSGSVFKVEKKHLTEAKKRRPLLPSAEPF